MSEKDAKPKGLVRKLAEVMLEVERVPKNGRNEFHRYDYATEADIADAVRKSMAVRSLMLIPSVEKTEWETTTTPKGGTQKLCTLTVRFRIMDGESGEHQDFTIMGQGQDSGDKATYKALTGAEKYAMLKLFLIPTGDDPEADSAPAQRHAPQQTQRPQTQTQAGTPGAREQAEIALSEATTRAEVEAVVTKIRQLSKPDQGALRPLYAKRLAEVTNGSAAKR